MILFSKREHTLISVFAVILIATSCRSQVGSVSSNDPSADTIVSNKPPFQTREPDRYLATRTITTVKNGGATAVYKNVIARDGEFRRTESSRNGATLIDLEIPAGRFLLLPDEKIYARITPEETAPDPEPESEPLSAEGLLHFDDGETAYQKIGGEMIEGRETEKYKVVVNSSTSPNVSVGETLLWFAPDLRMVVRSETQSIDGSRVTMVLSEIALDVDRNLFQIPAGYQAVESGEFAKRVESKR